MNRQYLFLCIVLLISNAVLGQKVEFEKTFDISKKAAKGVLNDVGRDESGNIALLYITGARYRSFKNELDVKSQVYRFDKEYNFIDEAKDRDKIKFKKQPKKKGENYSEECVEPDVNFSGVFMVRKVRYNYKWKKALNDYEVTYTQLEKVKPRDSKDRKLLYLAHTNSAAGDLAALTTAKPGPGSTTGKEFNILVIKSGSDISVASETTVSFESTYAAIGFCYVPNAAGLVDDNGEPVNDVVAILQCCQKGQQNKYIYLRFDANGKVVANNSFEAPVCWDFYFYPNGSNELILAGRANKNPKTMLYGQQVPYFEIPYQRTITMEGFKMVPIQLFKQSYATNKRNITGYLETPVIRATKATDYFIAYFKDNQFVSGQSYDVKNLTKQIKVTSKEKKPKAIPFNPYDNFANHFQFIGNELIIGSRITSKKGYLGYNLIHLSKDGKLKNIYQIKPEESNKSYAIVGSKIMQIALSKDGGVTCILAECEGADTYREMNNIYVRNLYRTRITKINTDGSLSSPITVGKNEKGKVKYYIDEEIPVIEYENEYMVLFGRDTGDDTLWFCKITY